ncbi:hypothetical protein D9M72_394130 [compost metagenome]
MVMLWSRLMPSLALPRVHALAASNWARWRSTASGCARARCARHASAGTLPSGQDVRAFSSMRLRASRLLGVVVSSTPSMNAQLCWSPASTRALMP